MEKKSQVQDIVALSKAELIDIALLKNISGGNCSDDGMTGGTSNCGGAGSGWTEVCGTDHGDWCGVWGSN